MCVGWGGGDHAQPLTGVRGEFQPGGQWSRKMTNTRETPPVRISHSKQLWALRDPFLAASRTGCRSRRSVVSHGAGRQNPLPSPCLAADDDGENLSCRGPLAATPFASLPSALAFIPLLSFALALPSSLALPFSLPPFPPSQAESSLLLLFPSSPRALHQVPDSFKFKS